MDERLNFGEWLSDRIYDAGLDQSQLAQALGLRPSAVSNWVNNTNAPGRKTIPDLARVLGIDRDELSSRAGALRQQVSNVSPTEGVIAAQKRTAVHLLAGVPADRVTWVNTESERRMIELPESWLTDVRSPAMAVTVRGDCLTSRGIFDGDLVICEPVSGPKDVAQGKVVLVRIEDQYTLKVWVWVSPESAELRDGSGTVVATIAGDVDFEVIGVARKRYGNVL